VGGASASAKWPFSRRPGGFYGPAGSYNTGSAYCRTRLQGSEKEVEVAGVAYGSRVKVEPVEGRIRRAYLPAEDEPHASTLGTHGGGWLTAEYL
jgi:hypothetical protein